MSDIDSLRAMLVLALQRIGELEDRVSNHQGLDWGAYGPNYPHPNQQIATAEYGGGIMRLDENGLQIKAPDATIAGLFYVYDFSANPNSDSDACRIKGAISTGATDFWAGCGSSNGRSAELHCSAYDTTQVSRAKLSVQGVGGTKDFGILSDIDGTLAYAWSDYQFKFLNTTSDPTITLEEGGVWYRSDTDKLRLRANGVTENLATESYIATADAVHPAVATDAHDASAISILDTANDFTATDVEGALAELEADNEAHVAAADPHTGYVLESLLDAKGDLISASAADTPALVTVGANDTILMADSGQAAGLKWAASQTPSTQAFSDAAAEGTADTFTRGDHKHGMPAAPTGAMPPIMLRPFANEPPAASYATDDLRNGHPVLDFDGAADEEAVWTAVLPAAYAGGGLTVNTFWTLTSATSGSLRVQAAIERIDASSLDIDADSFTAFQSAGGSAPGTSGMVIVVPVTFTSGAQMDSLVAGELFRVKIRRDADGTSGTDDIVTDAELLAVQIKET